MKSPRIMMSSLTNITVLSHDPDEAVQWLADVDIIRMPIQIAQVLATVWQKAVPGSYSKVINYLEGDMWLEWTYNSKANYEWLWNMGMDLLDEHFHRFGSRVQPNYRHGISRLLEQLGSIPPLANDASDPLPIQPHEAQLAYNPLGAFNCYTERSKPEWLTSR